MVSVVPEKQQQGPSTKTGTIAVQTALRPVIVPTVIPTSTSYSHYAKSAETAAIVERPSEEEEKEEEEDHDHDHEAKVQVERSTASRPVLVWSNDDHDDHDDHDEDGECEHEEEDNPNVAKVQPAGYYTQLSLSDLEAEVGDLRGKYSALRAERVAHQQMNEPISNFCVMCLQTTFNEYRKAMSALYSRRLLE